LPIISKKVWWRGLGPTFSKSLCLPETRRHFCTETTRFAGGFSAPRK
jgi:hypothetical protein